MTLSIFGGDLPWSSLDWTSSDDSVRGGGSFSNFECNASNPVATFSGYLDVKTLGGAGFASQRTTAENQIWDLTDYDGILICIKISDGKKYTLGLKDKLTDPTQSSISWDHDFTASADGEPIKLLWSDFKPTFRGRESKNAPPLDLKGIRRFTLMMRSFFGQQEGNFSLSLISIAAFKRFKYESYRDDDDDGTSCNSIEKLPKNYSQHFSSSRSWLRTLFGDCLW